MPDFKRLLRRLLGVDSSTEQMIHWTVPPPTPFPFVKGQTVANRTLIPEIVVKPNEDEDFCDSHMGIH